MERLFKDLRLVVIDEVHALAGTDRGAHLMSVIERVAPATANDIQRVGLSATVGHPDRILAWLQGTSRRDGAIIDPPKNPAKRELHIALYESVNALADEAATRASGRKSLFILPIALAHRDRCRANARAIGRRLRAPQLGVA